MSRAEGNPTSPMPTQCPECAHQNDADASVCSNCGAQLNPATPPPMVRSWLLGLLGTVVISAIGVAALIYVHDTAIPLGDRSEPAHVDTDSTFAREQADVGPPPSAAPAPPVAQAPTTTNLPPASETPPETAAADGATDGTTDAAAPLGENGNPMDAGAPATAAADSGSGDVKWSRTVLPPMRQRAIVQPAPIVVPGGADENLPESRPLARAPAHPVDAVGPAPAGSPQPGRDREGAATPAPAPDGAPRPNTGPPGPVAGQVPDTRTLAEAQKAGCGNESFLGGFVCRERVRLAFCDKRWNKHPDCMLQRQEPNL
ncbi:MAG: hypothetical protein R3E48_22690 [Burkholderiaceae bacterium]